MVIAALLAVQTHYNAKSRSHLTSPGDKSLSSTDSMNIQLFCLSTSIAQRVRDPRKPREPNAVVLATGWLDMIIRAMSPPSRAPKELPRPHAEQGLEGP